MPDNKNSRTLLSAYAGVMTSDAGCSNSRPAASMYVTPVAFFLVESRLIRSTWHPERSSKFGFLSSTGRMNVCGTAFAKCSHAKRSQNPQNTHVLSFRPSGFVYGSLMLEEGCGNG